MAQYLVNFINLFVGLRKTVAWFSLLIIGVIFTIKGIINGAEFVDLAKGTFLGFVAGNASEHISATVKEYFNSKGKKAEEVSTSLTGEG